MSLRSKRRSAAMGDRRRRNPVPRALFWLALLAVFVLATLPNPPEWPNEPSDKVQHFLAFVALMLLGAAAYPRLPPIKLALGLALFGGLIEGVQAVPALRRDSDWLDWAVDLAAAGCVLLALLAWRRLRARRP